MEDILTLGLSKKGNAQVGRAKGFNFDAWKAHFLVRCHIMDIASALFGNIVAENVGGVIIAAIGKDLL